MSKIQSNSGFASRAVAFGALAIGATAIGTLAIGWITIKKLRVFDAKLGKVHIERLTVGELKVMSTGAAQST